MDIGEGVVLSTVDNDIAIGTNSTMKSTTNAFAAGGALIGGTGADGKSKVGQNNKINIAKNVNFTAGKDLKIASKANNNAKTTTDGRSYGAVSVGVATTKAEVDHNGGVVIADATTTKNIQGKSISITSDSINTVDSNSKAGAGAALGIGVSELKNTINDNNTVDIGSGYNITTTGGDYIVGAGNANTYKAFNDSSAYGAVGVSVGKITNNITSNVYSTSSGNIVANGAIEVVANNVIKKAAVGNYDLYGGAGGIAGVGSAVLTDTINATTIATLEGNKAHANGVFNSGYITIGSNTDIDVNQKVDVTAGGGVAVASGITKVNSNTKTQTVIKNKDVKTKDDDIYFMSNSDVDIYTKSDVGSYGGIAVADGLSESLNSSSSAQVLIDNIVNATSGRNTYLQAISSKNVSANMYAETKGFIGAVGGSEATAKNVSSKALIQIDRGAKLSSYDSMNLTASDSSSVSATRKAKGTSYALFGIPITINGDGENQNTQNISNSSIVLNGTLESGLGANRKLTIDKGGTTTADGIEMEGKKKVGEVSSSNMESDIQIYKDQKEAAAEEYDAFIATENSKITNATTVKTNAEKQKADLETENGIFNTAITDAKNLKGKNTEFESTNSVINCWNLAYPNGATEVDNRFEAIVTGSSDTELKNAWSAYKADKTDTVKFNALKNRIAYYSTKADELSSEISSLKSSIVALENINYTNNSELTTFINTYTAKINENKNTIKTAESTIDTQTNIIDTSTNLITSAEAGKTASNEMFDTEIAKLEAQKTANSNGIAVYSIKIKDVNVRSGETNIAGTISGSGSITAPGNSFTIDILNNSVNDIVYGDLKIDRNARGGIYGANSFGGAKTLKYSGPDNFKISILNTVDANDPTININNGFGDMVLQGDLENVKGTISLVNYTGNILSDGSMTSKDIRIAVPNGGYTQNYTANTVDIGGQSGNGKLIAAGNIDISSKVINVNGLIQSGSEIKAVTIPDFKVTKEGGKYYQTVAGVKTEMKAGITEGYYYLNLPDNGQLDSELELIKAYFKPTDSNATSNVQGEIHLFKAEIEGGDITLTGNIISDTNKGKIVLINGYGKIDVKNNSRHTLVTSALNADTKVGGKLTINDFKLASAADTKFDNITQGTLEDYLAANAGKYEVSVDENGNIKTSKSGQTAGNGFWGATNNSTRADGANLDTLTYIPGSDAWVVEKAGETKTHWYQYYVKRSWWTELWHGKLYQWAYYTTYSAPVYAVKNSPITVQFQGFDTPSININSNGSIAINSNINALAGNVNLTSNNGSILTNGISNLISAKNIGLTATGNDIGESLKPIQVAVEGGNLMAKGGNIYLNYPSTNITNITVDATGNVQLATAQQSLGNINSVVNIKGNSLDLQANQGSINLANNNTNISVKKVKARANGDIAISNNSDLNITSIRSSSQGTISLESKTGDIIATDTEVISPYHIDGGNVILKSVNGAIGSANKALKIAYDGIYNVEAKNDIYLDSASAMYVDLIKSTEGKLNLNADYGIIASNSTHNIPYNIYSKGDLTLNSSSGSIGNLAISTDGILNASAGYTAGVASGLSDIKLSLISGEGKTAAEVESMTENQYNTYIENKKDMKIGTIKASKNVMLKSEKSILNADANSSITGEMIILEATEGDIGRSDSAISLNASREITAYAGNKKSVYLTNSGDLKITEVRSFLGKDGVSLDNVVLTSSGDIINASANNLTNIVAKNIALNANNGTGNIGSNIKAFTLSTVSNDPADGLTLKANNTYIKGISDNLNIVSLIANDIVLNSDKNISIANGVVNGIFENTSTNFDVTDTLTVGGNSTITTTEKTQIANATIGGNFTNNSNNTKGTGKLAVVGDSSITAAVGDIVLNNIDVDGTSTLSSVGNTTITNGEFADLVLGANNATLTALNSTGDVNISTTDNTTIAKALVDGIFENTSTNFDVTDTLTVIGNSTINSDSISIADAIFNNNLEANAKTINIQEINLLGNLNSKTDNITVNSSNDLNIGRIEGKTNAFVDKLTMKTNKSILNKIGSNQDIYVKNLNAEAKSIGDTKEALNVTVADGNLIRLKADDINIKTAGATINYVDLETKDLNLNANQNISITNLNVDKMNLKTTGSNVLINNGQIKTMADIYTNNKYIAINNTGLEIIKEANLQMYMREQPLNIMIDAGNNISTNSLNVLKTSIDLKINGSSNQNSQANTVLVESESGLKNTNTIVKTTDIDRNYIEKTPTQSSFASAKTTPANTGLTLVKTTDEQGNNSDNDISNVVNVSNIKNDTKQNTNINTDTRTKTSSNSNNNVNLIKKEKKK